MCAHSEFLKILTNELNANNLPYWIEQGGKHKKLHIELSSGSQFLIIPSTPSDHRGVKNSRAQLRKIIRTAADSQEGDRLGRHASAACA